MIFVAAVTGLLLPTLAYLGIALDGSTVSRERDSLAAELDDDLDDYLETISDSRRDLADVAEIGDTLKNKTFPDICHATQEAVDGVYGFYGTVRLLIGGLSADPPAKTTKTIASTRRATSADTSGPASRAPAPSTSTRSSTASTAWTRSRPSGPAFSTGSTPSRRTRGANPARSDPYSCRPGRGPAGPRPGRRKNPSAATPPRPGSERAAAAVILVLHAPGPATRRVVNTARQNHQLLQLTGDLHMTAPLDLVAVPEKSCAIGIDIGGTKIAAGVVTPDGAVLHAAAVSTPKRQDHLVQRTLRIIADMRSRYPDVAAVGVGAAGLVDWPSGHIRWAPNNSYRDLPLRRLLADGSGLPVNVDDDASAAAWAEATVGAGVGLGNVIVLTIGTGIGGGIILNGELHRGQSGIAGEIGHMIVNPEGGQLCGCGLTGCLEAMASGTALGRAGQRTAAADPSGRLAELAGTAGKVTGQIVYSAARSGDPAARHLFDQLGYWLGIGIASMANVFDPHLIVLGGGLVTTGNLLLTPTRASYERFAFARSHRDLPDLALARLGTEAGLIGAALLALHEHSGPRQPNSPVPGEMTPRRQPAMLLDQSAGTAGADRQSTPALKRRATSAPAVI